MNSISIRRAMRRFLRKCSLRTPSEQLLHPPGLRKSVGRDVFVELRRLYRTVRYCVVAALDQRARPSSSHAQTASPASPSLFSHFLVAIYHGRVGEWQRNLLPLCLCRRVWCCLLVVSIDMLNIIACFLFRILFARLRLSSAPRRLSGTLRPVLFLLLLILIWQGAWGLSPRRLRFRNCSWWWRRLPILYGRGITRDLVRFALGRPLRQRLARR